MCILGTNMSSLEFRLKKLDDTENYLLEEIIHNELMSKKTCKYLNYVEHFLTVASKVTGYFQGLCFNFCIYFINFYFYRYYMFCNRIKNLFSYLRN